MPLHLGRDDEALTSIARGWPLLVGGLRRLSYHRQAMTQASAALRSRAVGLLLGGLFICLAACDGPQGASACTEAGKAEISTTANAIPQLEGAVITARRDWSCAETSEGHALDLVFDYDGPADVVLNHYNAYLRPAGWQLLRQDREGSSTWTRRLTGGTVLTLNVHRSAGDDSFSVSIAEQPAT